MNRLRPVYLAALLLSSVAVSAQTLLPVQEQDYKRLGLVFSRLLPPQESDGSRFPGEVVSSPLDQSEVVAVYDGVLTSWAVQPGQMVQKGDLLGLVRSPAVLALQQQWLTARASQQQMDAKLKRDRQLFEDGVIAESRLQQTQREYRAAEVEVNSCAANLRAAGYDEAALARLESGADNGGDYRLLAGIDGELAHLHMMPGDSIATGDTLVSLTSDSLWVSAELPARMAATLKTGQQLMAQGVESPMVVRQMDRAVDQRSQTVGILAEFSGAVPLMPGQIVTLLLPASGKGFVIPADAVVHNRDVTSIYVKTPQGIENRILDLRPLGGDYFATAGVSAGDEIVVRGAAILKGIQLGLGGE